MPQRGGRAGAAASPCSFGRRDRLARLCGLLLRLGGLRRTLGRLCHPRILTRALATRSGLRAGLLGARLDQADRLVERDLVRHDVVRNGGVDAVVGHIRPVAALLYQDRSAALWMLANRAARIAAEAPSLAWVGALLGDQRHGAVEADRENLIDRVEACISLGVLDVRPEAADPGDDGLAVLRDLADLARQREELQGLVEIDVLDGPALRNARALRLLAFVLRGLTELQIGPETAGLDRNIEACFRILAQHLVGSRCPIGGELASEIAFRIVGAADKRAEPAELQRQATIAARWANTWIGAVLVGREEMRRQHLV